MTAHCHYTTLLNTQYSIYYGRNYYYYIHTISGRMWGPHQIHHHSYCHHHTSWTYIYTFRYQGSWSSLHHTPCWTHITSYYTIISLRHVLLLQFIQYVYLYLWQLLLLLFYTTAILPIVSFYCTYTQFIIYIIHGWDI